MLHLVSSNASVENQGEIFTSSRLKISFRFRTHICRHSVGLVYMVRSRELNSPIRTSSGLSCLLHWDEMVLLVARSFETISGKVHFAMRQEKTRLKIPLFQFRFLCLGRKWPVVWIVFT